MPEPLDDYRAPDTVTGAQRNPPLLAEGSAVLSTHRTVSPAHAGHCYVNGPLKANVTVDSVTENLIVRGAAHPKRVQQDGAGHDPIGGSGTFSTIDQSGHKGLQPGLAVYFD